MKKIPKSISINISPVVLYIEDLEVIEEIYKENFDDYKITAEHKKLEDNFEFASVQELIKYFNKKSIFKLHNLSFETCNHYINTDLISYKAELNSLDNDVKSIGITDKLKNAIDKRPMVYKYLSNYLLMLFLFNLSLSLLFLLLTNILPEPIHTIVSVSLILFFIIWNLWWYNLKTKNYSTIYLKRRSEQKSFWSEKKNSIILLFISAFIYIFREVIVSKLI